MSRGKIHIGTSGWHYQHWRGQFYPDKIKSNELLEFYAIHFQTVELNNTFYRLPTKEALNNWLTTVPDDFIFSVKASRLITHSKKLINGENLLENFFSNVEILNDKIGPILFQLPPSLKVNLERLELLLEKLPNKFRYVFEFRNTSWNTEEVYRLLQKYNIAFCIYELEHYTTPIISTANFVYVRLHGPEKKYRGSYSDNELTKWAKKINDWSKINKEVFIYFDNDQNAYAPLNALSLIEILLIELKID